MSKVITLLRRHAVAFTALFLLLGGTAYAVSGEGAGSAGSKKTMYACVTRAHHTLNLTSAEATCPDGQSKVSWDAAGPRGARGAAGAAGKAGARGATGPAGAVGAAGAAGPKGDAGQAGARGERGERGEAGAQGATGEAGPRGADGTDGTQGPIGLTGATGAAGPSGTSEFAEFFALMPPDNAATVAPGTDVSFPQNGPISGSNDIARTGPGTFNLAAIGTYRVAFNVSVTEAGQLLLTLDGADLAYTVTGRATGTSQITGEALVQTTSVNSLLTVRNPAGNATALTITPLAGGTRPVSATLIVQKLG